MKEWGALETEVPSGEVEGDGKRGEVSRWMRNDFGDERLEVKNRKEEKDFREGRIANLAESLAIPIHQRYQLQQ